MQLNDCHIFINFMQRNRMSMNFHCDVKNDDVNVFILKNDVTSIKMTKKKIRFVDVTVIFSIIIKLFKSAIFRAVSNSTFRFSISINKIIESFANHNFLDAEKLANASYKSIDHFNKFSIIN